MKILVTGLTSTRIGGMESHNLGNYVIAEPFFKKLRAKFPRADIVTTLQMSDQFYERFELKGLNNPRFWRYDRWAALNTASDLIRILLFRFFGASVLLRSRLLKELNDADLVIDFSGDIYGDNAKWNKFLEGNARLIFCLILKKPVAMLIGSPGPFQSFWRQRIAKSVLPRLDLVTNREPLSTAMLGYLGIKGPSIVSTACPSVFFEKTRLSRTSDKDDIARIVKSERPIIGFILCGWNMPSGPYNKWPRDDSEFRPFIEAIEYIIDNTEYRVCLMVHQNATTADGSFMRGNDHRLVARLAELLGSRVDGDRIYEIQGLYDAGQSKTLISHFEFLISGRIHAAVQALTQEIPTLIMDYGHEPKPHKLAGFARLYGVDDFLVSPNEGDSIIHALNELFAVNGRVESDLRKRIPMIKDKAQRNFDMVGELAKVE